MIDNIYSTVATYEATASVKFVASVKACLPHG